MRKPPLRILQVNTQDVGGGAANVAMALHEAYREAGHDAWFAVGAKHSQRDDVLAIPNERSRPMPVRVLRRAARHFKAAERVRGAWRLGTALENAAEPRRQRAVADGFEDFDFPGSRGVLDLPPQRPDLLHLHNLHGGYFDLRALSPLSHAVPTFMTLHDAWLLSGHCAHSFDCDRWQTGCGACPYLGAYPAVPVDRTAANFNRKRGIYRRSRLHIATPCRWLQKKVERSMLAEGMLDCRVIPWGVDLATFHPGDRAAEREHLGLPRDARIVLFAAAGIRRNPWKDYATLRDAVATAAVRMPGKQLLFVALGEGGNDEQIGNARVIFVPYQHDPRAVARFFRAADVYLHGTKADTFPTSILESLASGTPVIASDVGGIPEQVEHERTGYLCPVGDATDMADRLVALLSNDTLRQRMSNDAAACARMRHDVGTAVATYLDWFRDVLGQQTHARAA